MKSAGSGFCMTLLLVLTPAAHPQELEFVDLTAAPQRVEIRRPLSPALDDRHGIGAAHFSSTIGDCAADVRDPHTAAVYLDGGSGEEIAPSAPFEAEFRFLNTGRLPINVPLSPDRTDLQPTDPSIPFTYLSLALAVRVRDKPDSISFVELYGATDHKGTTRLLRPGEWIRVKAMIRLSAQAGCTTVTLVPGFWLRNNSIRASPEGIDWTGENICINETPATPVVASCRQTPGGTRR